MIELFIEGIKADLSEDLTADITYSLADIRTPEKRQVNYSKTLSLNGTSKNDFIFGYIFDIDVENPANIPTLPNVGVNFTVKKMAAALLIVDGVEVFNGTLRLWKIIKKGGVNIYEISLFGKLYDLFGLLADKKLTDLNFSEFNHALTWDNIKTTWASGFNGGYRYPYIDYGVNVNNASGQPDTFKFGSFTACILYKVYIDKIFAANNANYILNFSDRTIFDKLIVTPNIGDTSGSPKYLKAISNGSEFYTGFEYGYFYDAFIFNNTSLSTNEMNLLNTASKHGVIITQNISSSFQINFNYTTTVEPYAKTDEYGTPFFTGTGATITIFHRKTNNTEKQIGQISIELTEGGGTARVEIPRAEYLQNEEIYFIISMAEQAYIGFNEGTNIIAVSPTDLSSYPLVSGSIYDMKKSVPTDIKQIDFIKDFIKLFNLYVTQDPANPSTYIFTPQIDFYLRDKANVIDWTKKVDKNEDIVFVPVSQLTAKEYLFTWKQDKDYYTDLYFKNNAEVYGQIKYITDTDIITNTSKVEFLFSPAIMQKYAGSSLLNVAIFKIEIVNGILTRKVDKFNSRLLIWGGLQNAGHNITLLNSAGGNDSIISQYPFAGHIDHPTAPTFDLNFGNTNSNIPTATTNQFSKYWGKSLREAAHKDGKVVQCTMLITPADIAALNFAALYKIDSQFFRLNKIDGFNPFIYSTSKVEIIKVITL